VEYLGQLNSPSKKRKSNIEKWKKFEEEIQLSEEEKYQEEYNKLFGENQKIENTFLFKKIRLKI
jgi:hypothetical protein